MISRPYIFDYLSDMEASKSGLDNVAYAITAGANISNDTLKKLKHKNRNQIIIQDGMRLYF